MTLSKKLKLLMEDRNVSAVARRIGVHRDTLDGWIAGRSQPRVDSIPLLASALSVSIEWLISPDAAWPPIYITSNQPTETPNNSAAGSKL